ncbi:ribokinase [Bradyrhizobium sp. LHD-71]|uniref:ribokinase n=1 Tax=Bradyrhizobium sp. LHD-71 TaxID=3072141 RepID=UPI00280E903A|nr:ribokinase [Bradyrhizobium sp. LHD-71]MDQ8729930.1 ribokinase [Bradyrhizobium sp. LHD-71]
MGKVYVAGSINMDVVATTTRYPRLGETVPGKAVVFLPGGKGANQAVAAARLGAQTALIGRLGRDSFGADLRTFLAGQRVDLQHVQESENAPTGVAMITIADRDNAIVVVAGANAEVGLADIGGPVLRPGDVLVSQLEIPPQTIAAFFARGRSSGARTILNPAPAIEIDRGLFALADLVILNETELATFAHRPLQEEASLAEIAGAARALRTHVDQVICVTIGKRGALALVGAETFCLAAGEVEVVDTTGAGDCFTGAVAAELARGRPIRDALQFANIAASICVQRMGAGPSMPSLEEVTTAQGRQI